MFSKTMKKPPLLDTQEVYNLWDVLSVRHTTIHHINILEDFTHDIDLKVLLKKTIYKEYSKQIIILEKEMEKYNITLPRKPAESVRTPTNSEAFEDAFIATLIMNLIEENITLMLRAVRTTTTSDDLRSIFMDFLLYELKVFSLAIKYVKAKGWAGTPPMYPQVHPNTKERLDTGEVYHLWDHLTSRYDSLEISQVFLSLAQDGDLLVLLNQGVNMTLNKQIKVLEKEMNHFALPLPEKPPNSIKTTQDKDIIDDKLIFRRVFTGMQYMFELHAVSLKQNITNDRLRKIYITFLQEELSLYDKFIKYGKMKGWIRHVPIYSLSQ